MRVYRSLVVMGCFLLWIVLAAAAVGQEPGGNFPNLLKNRELFKFPRTLVRRDCVEYQPDKLRIVNRGSRGWVLTDGRHLVATLDNKQDAQRAHSLAARHTHRCFVGRDNKRSDRSRYVMDYWMGSTDLLTLAWPDDCTEYDPHSLRIMDRGSKGWVLTDGRIALQLLDNSRDARRALSIARRHTQKCYIGRGNDRPDPRRYILEYWKGTPARERCIEYDPAKLRVEKRGSAGWWVTDGDKRVAMLDNQPDALRVLRWARRHSATCFVGEGNKRSRPHRYTVQYWTGMELGTWNGDTHPWNGEMKVRALKMTMEEIPQFPWPPPQASAFASIPDEMVRDPHQDPTLLSDVDRRLSDALDRNGYTERNYYRIPEGFAVVTRLEQIQSDGTPREEPERWSAEISRLELQDFSLTEYLKALFTSNPGYYRVIVFAVTSQAFGMSEEEVSREEAEAWREKGLLHLPDVIGERPFTKSHRVTALIYEFELPGPDRKPRSLLPGRHTGRHHLEKANLLQTLERD